MPLKNPSNQTNKQTNKQNKYIISYRKCAIIIEYFISVSDKSRVSKYLHLVSSFQGTNLFKFVLNLLMEW